MAIVLIKQDDSHYTIELGERFDFGCIEEFKRAYESIDVGAPCELLMDFKATKYIDSSALGMLINAKSYYADKEVTIVLSNCNEKIKKIFSISRFEKKFLIK